MNCPNCGSPLSASDINIEKDIAKCSQCNEVFVVSDTLLNNNPPKSDASNFDLDAVPKGAWFTTDFHNTMIGATTRSAIAFFLVPFMLVWSGGALGGIYGSQIYTGEFDLTMSLFGIPFIIGAIIFWSLTLMAVWGKVEVTFDKTGGQVFTGLGKIGIKKDFLWSEVDRIVESNYNFKYPGSRGFQIVMEGKKRITFGTGLSEERRYYIFMALNKVFNEIR
jgi:hypothetical protein